MGGNLENDVVRFKISWEVGLFCTQIELAPKDGKCAVFEKAFIMYPWRSLNVLCE